MKEKTLELQKQNQHASIVSIIRDLVEKDQWEWAKGKKEEEKRKEIVFNEVLAELLDKNQLYVNLSEIDDAQFKVGEEDKVLNKAFYGDCQ